MTKSRENRIAELRSACGCKEGMIALVIGVAGYGLALRYFPIGGTTLQLSVSGIAAGLGSAVIGKLFGLLVARARLRRLLSSASATALPAPPAWATARLDKAEGLPTRRKRSLATYRSWPIAVTCQVLRFASALLRRRLGLLLEDVPHGGVR